MSLLCYISTIRTVLRHDNEHLFPVPGPLGGRAETRGQTRHQDDPGKHPDVDDVLVLPERGRILDTRLRPRCRTITLQKDARKSSVQRLDPRVAGELRVAVSTGPGFVRRKTASVAEKSRTPVQATVGLADRARAPVPPRGAQTPDGPGQGHARGVQGRGTG